MQSVFDRDGDLSANLGEQLCVGFRKRSFAHTGQRHTADNSVMTNQRNRTAGPEALCDSVFNHVSRELIDINTLAQDRFAGCKCQSRRCSFEGNGLPFLVELLIDSKVQRMDSQVIVFGIVEGQAGEVVLDLAAQTVRDGIQYLSQVQVGDDCIVDFEQDVRPVRWRPDGGLTSMTVRQTMHAHSPS